MKRTTPTSNFSANIELRGINPYILVDASVAKALRPGWRKALPVLMRINGKPIRACRTNLMPAGNGAFHLYLNATARVAAGVSTGDRVQVELAYDATYRNGPQHPMPALFRRALEENTEARTNWKALAPSRKKEVLRYFAQLKSDDALVRNIEKALHVLSGHTGRFMARTWMNGS